MCLAIRVRSFFRYYKSKDDLLAQSVVVYSSVLVAQIGECPVQLTPLDTVRQVALSAIKHSEAQPRMRQIIEIAQRSPSARQAHLSRLAEVEDTVAEAFAARLNCSSTLDMRPRLLSCLTLMIMNVAIVSWFNGEHQNLSTAVKHVFVNLTRTVCDMK